MTTTYTNIFGGAVVSPASQSFIAYSLTALVPQIVLVWPQEFVDSANFVANIINVTASTTGTSLVMPDATLVSVGQSSAFVNLGANAVTLYANDGVTVITTLLTNSSYYIYLTDTSTTNGTWNIIPFGGGSAGSVTSVGIASSSPDISISGSPITSSGVITLGLAGDLLSLTSFGSGAGIVVHTGTNTYSLTSILGAANQITVINGNGASGSPTISLPPAISGINSIVVSNIQIGLFGQNQISTADGNPLQLSSGLTLLNSKILTLFNSLNGYVAFMAPASITSNITYTLPGSPPPFAGYVLSSSPGGIMSWVSGGGGGPGSAVSVTVTQSAHGFSVGQALYLNGATYTLAEANSAATAEVVGVVSQVLDANDFVLTTVGHIVGLSGLTAGTVYFLSDATPGLVTATEPTTVGNIEKPIWIADSSTTAFIYQERGRIIPNPITPTWIDQTTTPVTLVAQSYYVADKSTEITFNMPATVAFGSLFTIAGKGSGGWVVQFNTEQTGHLDSSATTMGGTITFANQWDCIQILCVTANTTFVVTNYTGSPTPA